ncbi:ectonucleoside triphosphate diphosphohydrolase 5-like [Contarinia nasturtii]|uniref:ectonucleoside triphosphate diphosphohydrolase 5-like n=1 Tax=Contarinia nasturtii TaxID=265458 RepID=UPI0012D4B774|nr:ectonucleoside triphosphate diphosphohydrolase 5-like [Contarinia nasturtii]
MTIFSWVFFALLIECYVKQCAGMSTGLQYVVVIDAGSTGSRAITYKFNVDHLNRQLQLNNRESVKQMTPGLHEFWNNPIEGGNQIQKLLEHVKEDIPKENLASTQLILRATGGMRKLKNPNQAENILKEVRKVFSTSGFYINGNSAEILDAVDEGIFSWFTINFLLGLLGSKKTVAALDMGGASTQVSFAIEDKLKSKVSSVYDHVYSVVTPNYESDVFSLSSELGLDVLLYKVLKYGTPNGTRHFNSVCMRHSVKLRRFYLNTMLFTVSGAPNRNLTIDFDACMDGVKKVTLNTINPKLHIENQRIFAFSGFAYKILSIGLIDSEKGGRLTLNDILSNTKIVCNTKTKDPFLCLHLTYIYVLLHHAYGLNLSTNIEFRQNVNGHVVSWTLGCAIDLLFGISKTKKYTSK